MCRWVGSTRATPCWTRRGECWRRPGFPSLSTVDTDRGRVRTPGWMSSRRCSSGTRGWWPCWRTPGCRTMPGRWIWSTGSRACTWTRRWWAFPSTDRTGCCRRIGRRGWPTSPTGSCWARISRTFRIRTRCRWPRSKGGPRRTSASANRSCVRCCTRIRRGCSEFVVERELDGHRLGGEPTLAAEAGQLSGAAAGYHGAGARGGAVLVGALVAEHEAAFAAAELADHPLEAGDDRGAVRAVDHQVGDRGLAVDVPGKCLG